MKRIYPSAPSAPFNLSDAFIVPDGLIAKIYIDGRPEGYVLSLEQRTADTNSCATDYAWSPAEDICGEPYVIPNDNYYVAIPGVYRIVILQEDGSLPYQNDMMGLRIVYETIEDVNGAITSYALKNMIPYCGPFLEEILADGLECICSAINNQTEVINTAINEQTDTIRSEHTASQPNCYVNLETGVEFFGYIVTDYAGDYVDIVAIHGEAPSDIAMVRECSEARATLDIQHVCGKYSIEVTKYDEDGNPYTDIEIIQLENIQIWTDSDSGTIIYKQIVDGELTEFVLPDGITFSQIDFNPCSQIPNSQYDYTREYCWKDEGSPAQAAIYGLYFNNINMETLVADGIIGLDEHVAFGEVAGNGVVWDGNRFGTVYHRYTQNLVTGITTTETFNTPNIAAFITATVGIAWRTLIFDGVKLYSYVTNAANNSLYEVNPVADTYTLVWTRPAVTPFNNNLSSHGACYVDDNILYIKVGKTLYKIDGWKTATATITPETAFNNFMATQTVGNYGNALYANGKIYAAQVQSSTNPDGCAEYDPVTGDISWFYPAGAPVNFTSNGAIYGRLVSPASASTPPQYGRVVYYYDTSSGGFPVKVKSVFYDNAGNVVLPASELKIYSCEQPVPCNISFMTANSAVFEGAEQLTIPADSIASYTVYFTANSTGNMINGEPVSSLILASEGWKIHYEACCESGCQTDEIIFRSDSPLAATYYVKY